MTEGLEVDASVPLFSLRVREPVYAKQDRLEHRAEMKERRWVSEVPA